MKIDFSKVRAALQGFRFGEVFVEHLNWSHPRSAKAVPFRTSQGDYRRVAIAELAGVVVFEVTADDGAIPDAKHRAAVHKELGRHHHEHLLLFLDAKRTQSLWSWLKRDDGREQPRTHLYVRGQPGDLFLTRLDTLVFELAEFDPDGRVPIVEVSRRLRAALDVEAVTRKFYGEFKAQHLAFLGLIKGIRDRRKRRWYASVLLNRLMFIYFLQKKGFLDGGDLHYLRGRLARAKANGSDRYFRDFLKPLFFEGFARPPAARSAAVREAIGAVPYLNGGLFLPHALETEHPELVVPDRAFDNLLELFDRYTWSLDDTPGGKDDEINPDVLGYIFEKYINQSDDDEARTEKDIHQKSSGAYYTRPEITAWLAEQTLHRRLLDLVNEDDLPGVPGSGPGGAPRRFEDVADLLLHADARLCKRLLDVVLPGFKVLDPACGSGAFLVAALKALLDLYGAVTGRAEVLGDEALEKHVAAWQREARGNLGYFLKRRVVTDNLFGVDVMEEATEIAKLRLFLALVASAATLDQLEPLPNVDFNLMAGNSLVGLLHVDDRKFARKGQMMLLGHNTYRSRVTQKNHLVSAYRRSKKHGDDLAAERAVIEDVQRAARQELDGLLLEEFIELGIKHQQPTWDEKKGAEAKAATRPLKLTDLAALHPFHWGYEFDEVLNDPRRGGFDVVLANPPWEVFKPNGREFFLEHSELVSRKSMSLKEFEAEKKKCLADKDLRKAWLEYLARYPHVNDFFRRAEQYKHQVSVVDGRKAGADINLYKLFVEQCLNLLRPGGQLGMVVPSSLYSDLGATELRRALFEENTLRTLFCFSNERYLFDGVDHRFKICLFTAARGGHTEEFPTAFRINPREAITTEQLPSFLRDARNHVRLTPALVRKMSPGSLSILELKSDTDRQIVERMTRFPLIGDVVDGAWGFELCREFHMKDDADLFDERPSEGRVALMEGKGIHQYNIAFKEPQFWIEVKGAQDRLREMRVSRYRKEAKRAGVEIEDPRLTIESEHALVGFRKFARNTDERTLIAAVVPAGSLVSESFTVHRPTRDVFSNGQHQEEVCLTPAETFYVAALLNSFVLDWALRMRVDDTVSMFYVYQLPMPRLTAKDAAFGPIVERAAKLTCTTATFDELARAVGLRGHRDGVTDPEARLRLRAELDGLVAHLYGLTEEEFQHVLQSFPVVPEAQRVAAHNAYRDLARGRR